MHRNLHRCFSIHRLAGCFTYSQKKYVICKIVEKFQISYYNLADYVSNGLLNHTLGAIFTTSGKTIFSMHRYFSDIPILCRQRLLAQ